nr:histidine kinase [uncultured Dyadobacter sp.]
MKNITLFLLAGIAALSPARAQINWSDYSQSFPGGIRKTPSTVALMLAIRKENDAFRQIREKSAHFDALAKDPYFRRLRPRDMITRTTFDTANAQFFLHGVNPQNAHAFRFRVTEYPGNRILVPWNEISSFTDSTVIRSSGFPEMAYLGGYKARPGALLIMDVSKVEDNRIVATSLVAWESVRPEITGIYTSETLDEFFRQLQSPWLPDSQSPGSFPSVLTVPSTNTNLIFALQNGVFGRKQIEYQLLRDGRVYSDWRHNAYDGNFVWIKDIPPGQYVIKIRYSAQPSHTTEYAFNIVAVWYRTVQVRMLAGILVASVLVLSFLLIRQRRKARQQEMNRTRLQLELKAIYAQLNPHFIFNALNSIQGLVNKQDIKGANSYLSDFARLTRDSLLHSQKSEIALHEEIQTLDTYLKLEKLRFGFEYSITVDPAINAYETNIPALLLQPLVENAVKHGVASLGAEGKIELTVGQSGRMMIVKLTDNGKGLTEAKPATGLGLKLTRDRIELLNQLHQDWQLSLTIGNAAPQGAQIMLTFNHWF